MARRTLKRMYGLSEDRVATRALTDILGKAVASGALSDVEKSWARKLTKAIEKSGPDQLTYPILSFEPDQAPPEKPGAGGKAKKPAAVQPPTELDPLGSPDPANSQAQSVWDTFANYPTKPQDDIELGAAGPPPKAEPEKPSKSKKPGMLSRVFGGGKKDKAAKPPSDKEPKPSKAVAQSTWDDTDHGRGKEPEDREKPGSAWDEYSNQGSKGTRGGKSK